MVLAALIGGCGSESSPVAPVEAWPVDAETGLRVPSLGPVPELEEWADNPSTEAKARLGRMLFTDTRLSGSGRGACGACHFQNAYFQTNAVTDLPDRSWPDIEPRLPRNTPSLLNLGHAPRCRWDGGHCETLPDAMMLPFAEANMNLTDLPADDVLGIDVPAAKQEFYRRVVEGIPGYDDAFAEAFDVDVHALSADELWGYGGQAFAVMIRAAESRDAPFDRWNAGDDTAMSEAQKRGLAVFLGPGGCIACHYGPLFSDFGFHNLSTEPVDEEGRRADEGRYLITGDPADRGAFLTPTLRSVAMTGPWFHHGGESDMRALIRYVTGEEGRRDPNHDPILDGLERLDDQQVDDLAQFLKALTAELPGEEHFVVAPAELPGIDVVPLGTVP